MEVLRISGVRKKLGIGESTIRKLCKTDPTFPKPFKLSSMVTVWDNAELDQWLITKKQGDNHVA